MIYIYGDSIDLSTMQFESLKKLSSSERLLKMSRYKFPKDQNLCLIAFAMLRYALLLEYGIEYIPKVSKNAYGKPYLEDGLPYFNLSHCDNAVSCILDTQEVGIDIQNYCSSIFKDRESTRLWTIQEAYGKYYGYGLNYRFQSKDFSYIENASCWQDYEDLKVISYQYQRYVFTAFARQCMSIRFISIEDLLKKGSIFE